MINDGLVPVYLCRLIKSRGVLRFTCPACGEVHQHGFTLRGPGIDFCQHRVAHCKSPANKIYHPDGYFIYFEENLNHTPTAEENMPLKLRSRILPKKS